MSGYTVETITVHGFAYDVLETSCVGGCSRRYRIDSEHSDYKRVLDALAKGDRSIIRCPHDPTPLREHG